MKKISRLSTTEQLRVLYFQLIHTQALVSSHRDFAKLTSMNSLEPLLTCALADIATSIYDIKCELEEKGIEL